MTLDPMASGNKTFALWLWSKLKRQILDDEGKSIVGQQGLEPTGSRMSALDHYETLAARCEGGPADDSSTQEADSDARWAAEKAAFEAQLAALRAENARLAEKASTVGQVAVVVEPAAKRGGARKRKGKERAFAGSPAGSSSRSGQGAGVLAATRPLTADELLEQKRLDQEEQRESRAVNRVQKSRVESSPAPLAREVEECEPELLGSGGCTAIALRRLGLFSSVKAATEALDVAGEDYRAKLPRQDQNNPSFLGTPGDTWSIKAIQLAVLKANRDFRKCRVCVHSMYQHWTAQHQPNI